MVMFFKFLSVFVVALVILGYGFLKIIPKMLADAVKQNRDYELKQALQTDSYYRESGSSILQEIMQSWIEMATDLEAMKKTTSSSIRKLIQKTIGYASEDTIKIAAHFFQYVYNEETAEEKTESVEVASKGMVYLAMIVSSLKKDFTGQNLEPAEILKITLKDYTKYEAEYTAFIHELSQILE